MAPSRWKGFRPRDGSCAERSPSQFPPERSTAARVGTVFESGAPEAKVDIAILGDGYREAEHSKFADDAARAAGYLFSVEPLQSRRRDFNVRLVFAASAESGVTDHYLGLKKDTALRCAYGSAAAERTLVAADNRAVREIASEVGVT